MTLDWAPKTVAVWQEWDCGRYVAFKTNFYGPWHLSDDDGKTSIFTDDHLQEVMAQAQAIEARRAATLGAVHESAVPTGCAETPPDLSSRDTNNVG